MGLALAIIVNNTRELAKCTKHHMTFHLILHLQLEGLHGTGIKKQKFTNLSFSNSSVSLWF